ncbi:hypothetical protein ACI5KX_04155 [Erythrobacter sp. GH1-10]|uniref:hypothetical protein n=1 Tax=Erythrobacter sp. GH1-10 TaxID=3349334 RepID=UPI00387796A4
MSGALAMFARKGNTALHTTAGNFYVVSMLFMAGSASALTWWEYDPLSMLNGLVVMYLVATSWMAVRQHGKGWRRYEWAILPVGAACVLALGYFGFMATQSPTGGIGGFSPEPYFVFGGIGLMAVLLDLNYLLRDNVNPRQRIARHLWRMVYAYLLAATALFLGQQDDVFFFMAGSQLLFIPSLATLAFLAFWIIRVRFAKNWLRPIWPVRAKATPNTEVGA